MKVKKTFFVFLAGLYFLSSGISYAVFNFTNNLVPAEMQSPLVGEEGPKQGGGHLPAVDISGPKDQVCPINGAKLTKAEKELWEKRRPLLVMIENHKDSRPQSGLSRADVVYEVVAEGAITRFMGVFYCANAAYALKGDYDLGPVRSARTYFLDWASEYGDYPLYVHVGGAHCSPAYEGGPCKTDPRAQALEQIARYGWLNKDTRSDLNQFALGFKVCRREPDRVGKDVATEHTMYCSSEALWATAEGRKLTNVNYKNQPWDKTFREWKFKEDEVSGGSVSPEFDFWRDYKDYQVRWDYDRETNTYKRSNGGEPQIDFNTKEQLAAKNVVVQFTQERGPVDEIKHLLYDTVGSGKALIFQDGKVIEGKWSKKTRTDRTLFYDAKGKEIQFNRGLIWIEILPLTSKVNY
jgi:hypothetical protein